MSSESRVGESQDAGKPRVLLILDAAGDRRVLSSWLRDRHDVVEANDDAALQQDFDLCILDTGTYARLWAAIGERKRRSEPVFLPFVLITSRQTAHLVSEIPKHDLDEVLEAPAEHDFLLSRVDVLLGRRQRELDLTAEREHALEMLRKSEQRFELLSEANSLLLSTADPEAVIQTIAEDVMTHLGSHVFFNYILDAGSDRLRLNAWGGVDQRVAKMIERLELGQAICGCVARDGERIISEDVQHNGDRRADLVRRMGVRCYCCHPLKAAGQTVGTLSFGTKSKDCFDAEEVELMRTIANQISIAIERVRSEQESHFQSFLLESVSDSVIVYYADEPEKGKLVYVNEAAYRTRGYTRDEMQQLNVMDLIAPEWRPKLQGRLDKLAEGEEVRAASAHVRRDGTTFPVEVWLRRIEFGDRSLVVNVSRDTTERERAEKALRESEAEAKDLIRYAPTGIYEIDFRMRRFTSVNEAMAVLSGYSREELLAMDPMDLLAPESGALFAERMAKTLAGEEPSQAVEYVVRKKDGSEIFVQLNVRFELDEHGRPGRALVIGHDVTERRRQEEELRRALRQQGILHEVALSSANAVAEADFAKRLSEALLGLLDAKVAFFWQMDDSGEHLAGVGSAGLDEQTSASLFGPVRADGDTPVAAAFRTGRPSFYRDAERDALPGALRTSLLDQGIRAGIALPLSIRDEPIGAISLRWAEPMAFDDRDLDFFMSLASALALGLENARLFDAERQRARLGDSLAAVDELVHSSLTFAEIIDRAVPEGAKALGAANAAVSIHENRSFRVIAAFGFTEDIRGTVIADDLETHSLLAMREQAPVAIEDASTDPRVVPEHLAAYGITAVLVVPLIVKGEAIGDLYYNFASGPRHFSDAEVDFCSKLGSSLSLALENARLYEAEHDIADRLQEALLSMPDEVPGLEFAHAYHSATEAARVGGDFYDVFELSHDHVGIVIGDVAGKGLNAAVLTSMVKNTIRAHANERGKMPKEILTLTNEVIYKSTTTEAFVTVFFGILDCRDGRLVYGNAGHTTSAIRGADGKVGKLPVTGPILGAFGDVCFDQAETRLGLDQLLFLYTDGLTEAREDGELYGEERVFARLSATKDAAPSEVVATMIADVIAFGGNRLRDDMALLALRRVAQGAETPRQQRLEM